jgi:hypothetical protein
VIARVVVAVAALAVGLALAADLRDARALERAVAEASQPGRLDASAAALRAQAAGTRDTAPLLREAEILLSAERYREALAPAQRAARREPGDAQAWLIVALAASGAGDAAAEREAQARISRLVARP